jgi:class 3 adenylate cyclase/Tfp pilus assembly protein PilF
MEEQWATWRNTAAPDTARLRAVQTLSWKAVFEQPDSGIALANAQLELAIRANDLKAQYEAHTTLAVGNSMKGGYTTALSEFEQSLAVANAMGDLKRASNTYSNLSNVYRNLGDLPMALEQLQRCLRIETEMGNKEGLAGTYNNLGNIHTELGELDKALANYERSGALAEELDSPKGRAQALLNLGNTHMQMGSLDTAEREFIQGAALYKELGRKLEMGIAFNNLGRTYGLQGNNALAHAYLDTAEVILIELGSVRQLARTYLNRGNVHLGEGRTALAAKACERGHDLAVANELLLQRKECLQCMEEAYARSGDFRKAHAAQKEFLLVHDSLLELNNGKEVTRLEVTRTFQERMLVDSLANVRTRFEDELAYSKELGREREQRNIFLFIGVGVLVLAGGLWNRLRYTRRSRAEIQREMDRSESLLLNILPAEVALELKDKGTAVAKHHDRVTVLFTDFKGFTEIAGSLSPAELVEELNACFHAFDEIVGRYGIEKIKTIGDAYMAAGGIPEAREDSALHVVQAALDMQEFMISRRAERSAKGLPAFSMRAGVHTGDVVAGIVGARKFQYDIWGDAVNTAARMESSGEVDQVNISSATYSMIKDSAALHVVPRGLVQAKGKGEMEMFFAQRGA